MPILHRRRAQDKTVLSCPRLRCEMNSQHVKTVGDRKFRNWFKTSLQTRSHRRQDWIKLFSLQYIEDY